MDRETKEYLQDKAAEAECWITELLFALRDEVPTDVYLDDMKQDEYVCANLATLAQEAQGIIRKIQKHIHEDLKGGAMKREYTVTLWMDRGCRFESEHRAGSAANLDDARRALRRMKGSLADHVEITGTHLSTQSDKIYYSLY